MVIVYMVILFYLDNTDRQLFAVLAFLCKYTLLMAKAVNFF